MWQRLLTTLLIFASCLFGGATAYAQGRVVTVDPAFLQGTIQLQVGDTLQVFLKSNAGPGYSWQITENNPTLLQPLGTPLAQTRGTIPYQVVRFRSLRVGVLRLTMVYQNPKLKIAPKDTFRATVAIDLTLAPRKVIVTERDNGKAISLSVGDILVVKLPINAEADLRWVPFGNVDIVLRPIRTFTQNPGNALPKGYLYQVFHYQAARPAILHPTFNLQNSAGLPQKNFSLVVTIQAPTQNNPLPITPRKSVTGDSTDRSKTVR